MRRGLTFQEFPSEGDVRRRASRLLEQNGFIVRNEVRITDINDEWISVDILVFKKGQKKPIAIIEVKNHPSKRIPGQVARYAKHTGLVVGEVSSWGGVPGFIADFRKHYSP